MYTIVVKMKSEIKYRPSPAVGFCAYENPELFALSLSGWDARNKLAIMLPRVL